MEYIDSQVDIHDEEPSESSVHGGEHIDTQIDMNMYTIDERLSCESPLESLTSTLIKPKKRDSERAHLSRHMSDTTLNRLFNDSMKTTTELKGRDHILRLMKTNRSKPIMESKNHLFVQTIMTQRQEKQETHRSISDFAAKYGLMDISGKKIRNRNTSEPM
jgi:hypothetical protein